MIEATNFLVATARAVGAMALYPPGHPAHESAVEICYEHLVLFQEAHPTARFSFLEEFTVLGRRPVPTLRKWDWGRRLSASGIQRVELTGPVSRAELEDFLDDAMRRLAGEPRSSAEVRETRETHLRYGLIAGGEGGTPEGEEPEEVVTVSLSEETEAVDWLHTELREGGALHLVEADTVVQSLSRAMHGDQEYLVPLLRLKHYDEYTTTHAMNVAVLAMALAEAIELDASAVRAFGIAGLLHDLGKVMIPTDILNKEGRLTRGERLVMNQHPIEGARIILGTEQNLDLAAVVAYEHHIKLDGTGYPALKYARACHLASDLVHICDVFDALRTRRPYRDSWEAERVLRYLERGAGSEFDIDLTRAFVRMMRIYSRHVAEMEDREEPLLVLGPRTRASTPSKESPPELA